MFLNFILKHDTIFALALSFSLSTLHLVLGCIALSLTIIFNVYKFYQSIKNKKTKTS